MLRPIQFDKMPIPEKPLEKTAFLGALLRRFGPTAMARPLGTAIDKGIQSAGRRWITDPKARGNAMRYVAGLGRQGTIEAAQGAAIGGLLEGGINAYTAEPGDRGHAFMQGLGHGALSGAAFGGIAGVGSRAVRNLRNVRQQGLAQKHNVPFSQVRAQAEKPGFLDNLKSTFGDKGLKGELARTRTMAGLGTVGAGWVLPDIITGASEEAVKPPPMQQPQFQPNTPSVYEQPQYFKAGSLKTVKRIDFTKMPSYHR